MAVKIPQYENRLVPQGNGIQANMQVATPVDDSGKALQAIGEMGFRVAGLLQKKEDDDAIANIGPSLAESSAYWPSRIQQLSDSSKDGGYVTNADGSTSTLVQSVRTEFDDWQSKFLGNITNAKARQYAQQHINSMMASTLHSAMTTEARLGVENRKDKVAQAVDAWASQAMEGGVDVAIANMAQADSLIANIGLPQELRNDAAKKARSAIAEATIRGMTVRDPAGVNDAILARLNVEHGYLTPEQQDTVKALTAPTTPNYGNRPDGTPKGNGWLGPIKMKSGDVMTELTVGVNIDGKETNIPAIVPTLSKDEVAYLADGNKPTDAIIDKAVAHAKQRIAAGKSPYADTPAAAPASVTIDQLWPGLIKQESGGKQSVVSSEGAIGVAQIMPGTAPEAAKLAGLPYDANRLKTDAAYNEALGKAYLQKQMDTFGDPAKALGAYNAGPGRVKSLVAKYGENWLSHAPKETQNYVASIMANVTPAAPADALPANGVDKTVTVDDKGGHLNIRQVVNALPFDKLVPYLHEARSEDTRQQTAFRANFTGKIENDLAQAKDGLTVQSPATATDFINAFGAAEGPKKYEAYNAWVKSAPTLKSMQMMPLDQQAQELAKFKPVPGSPNYATQDQIYTHLSEQVQRMNADRASDPILWAFNNKVGTIKPFQLTDPQTAPATFATEMLNRVGVMQTMSSRYGAPPVLLSKSEQAQVSTFFNNVTEREQLRWLQSLHGALGDTQPEAYRAIIQQLRPDSPVTANAGEMVAMRNVMVKRGLFSNTFVDPAVVAERMLRGEALLNPTKADKKEDGTGKVFPMPPAAKFDAQVFTQLGDAFAMSPKAAQIALQSIRAYYAGEASVRGIYSDQINSELLNEAVQNVTGGITTIANKKVIRPWGMSEGAFVDLAHEAFTQAMRNNGLPENLWGRAKLYNDVNDTYLVRNGDLPLIGKDGQQIRIKVDLGTMMQMQGAPGAPGAPAGSKPQAPNDWINWLTRQDQIAQDNKRAVAEAQAKANGTTVEEELRRWTPWTGMPKQQAPTGPSKPMPTFPDSELGKWMGNK